MYSPGSSSVSSIVRMRWFRGNSINAADSNDVFPAPLAPHINIVARLLIRNEIIPAILGLTVPLEIKRLSVHGRTECFLMATALPWGLSGYPTTVALASNPPRSVSRTGLEAQKRRPLLLRRMFTRLSTSRSSAIRLVEQRMCEFNPSIPFTVTCMRLEEHGAST